MDVWFDSGSTHAAVLEERPELRFPADMYMEGGDQFRGWFQSSLLTSVASKGCAPYKSVLCHGWVVDEQGKQMHKSAGNGVEPSEIIKDYGADIIRLWVASSDYTVDVRAGKNIFKQLSEAYRKIRNTARFILGNLDGFDPNTDCVADDQLQDIDRWLWLRWMTSSSTPTLAMLCMTSTRSTTLSTTSVSWPCPTSIWTSPRIACTAPTALAARCADRDVQDPRRSGQDHRSHPLLHQPGDLGLPAQDRGYEQIRRLRGYAEGWPVRS